MNKIKSFYIASVKPLLLSRCFCGIVLFYLTIAYGYYLFNANVCKDGFWVNIAQPGYSLPFTWSAQMRWGLGLCGWLSSLFGFMPAVSGLVGLLAWFFGSCVIVAYINNRLKQCNPVFSSLFVVSLMAQPLFSELLLWPNYFTSIGIGIFVASNVVLLCEYNEVRICSRCFFLEVLALAFAFSLFEVFVPFYLMLVVGAWLLGEIVGGRVFSWRRVVYQVALLIGAIVVKIGISLFLMSIGRFVFGMQSVLYAGSDVGIPVTGGLVGFLAVLSKHIFRDFVFRGLADFSVLCVTVSMFSWVLMVAYWTWKRKSLVVLLLGLAFLSTVFFFPVIQGRIVGYRVLLPMMALFLPCVIYASQWLRWRYGVLIIMLVFVTILVSKTSVVLSEVCDRFEMDRLHGTCVVNEIKRVRKDKELPVVIVGCLNEYANKKLPFGVAYNLQGSAKPSWIESRFNHFYVKGGYCGMGTLLDASEIRRVELYRFLSWLDASEYMVPSDETTKEACAIVGESKIPQYPLDGFATIQKLSSGEVLIVNLGGDVR